MTEVEYTYDELIEALDAEAATLDPEQWEGGWDAHEYLIDASRRHDREGARRTAMRRDEAGVLAAAPN